MHMLLYEHIYILDVCNVFKINIGVPGSKKLTSYIFCKLGFVVLFLKMVIYLDIAVEILTS